MTIHTITLTNRKTGIEIRRDYDLDKPNMDYNKEIFDMKEILEDNSTIPF